MNAIFQELKGRLNMAEGDRKNEIINLMRENLKERNMNNDLYTLEYTHQGETININNCDEQELLKIDGDMVVFGK